MTGAGRASRHDDPDRAIARLAARQHGIVTRGQLLTLGVSPQTVGRRRQAGRLRSLHRGVYAVGPIDPPRAMEMAACLACGETAVVSHRTAASLWKLMDCGSGPPEITVRDPHPRRRPGIRVRRSTTLRSDEVTTLDGVPITTPARTLLDLAAVVGTRDLERAAAEAFALRLATSQSVRKLLDRHPNRPGAPRLLALLDRGRPARTRSVPEERFLGLMRKAGVEPSGVNVLVADHRVDFVWNEERLVVETDGFAFHSSPRAFEQDRARDADLLAAGFRVMRVTAGQLADEPEAVIARVVRTLAAR